MHTITCNTCDHHMEGTDEAAVVIELQWHLEYAHDAAELVTFTYRSPSPEYVEVPHPEITAWLEGNGYPDLTAWMLDSDYAPSHTSPTGWVNVHSGDPADPLDSGLGAMESAPGEMARIQYLADELRRA